METKNNNTVTEETTAPESVDTTTSEDSKDRAEEGKSTTKEVNESSSTLPEGDKEATSENIGKKEEIPLEVFKVGNLMFKCHCCGHTHTVEEGIKGGVRFDLYATNKHRFVLACPKCKATLEMHFEKGKDSGIVDMDGNPVPSNPVTKETQNTNESTVQEENKQEETV